MDKVFKDFCEGEPSQAMSTDPLIPAVGDFVDIVVNDGIHLVQVDTICHDARASSHKIKGSLVSVGGG